MRLENLSDIELYGLLQNEKAVSEKAFSELYSRHSSRVFAYCRRFLGDKDDAKDVFQETFVRFYNSSKQDRVMTNVPAFLLRIARNLCVNAKRKEKHNVSVEDYMLKSRDDLNDKEELLGLIKTALDLLPEDYKEAFILREYDNLSYNEIADLTNVPLSTVKIRIFRAKQKIREILSPYMEDLSKY